MRGDGSRCAVLLLALVSLFVLYPLLEYLPFQRAFLALLYSFVLVGGVWAVRGKGHRQTAISVVAATVVLAASGLSLAYGSMPVAVAHWVAVVAFLGYTTIVLLGYVLSDGAVSRDKLYGAASVYFLLGLVWAGLYALVETVSGGSFAGLSGDPQTISGASDLLYFSFVTLTTLGYGEITPVTSRARSLAVLEATAGVLYVAILIARLVSGYRSDE